MTRFRHRSGRILGLPLAAVLLALSLVSPLLERHARGDGAAFESEHSEATCVQGHDHTLCVLSGTLRGRLPASAPAPLATSESVSLLLPGAMHLPSRSLLRLSRSRAPPSLV